MRNLVIADHVQSDVQAVPQQVALTLHADGDHQLGSGAAAQEAVMAAHQQLSRQLQAFQPQSQPAQQVHVQFLPREEALFCAQASGVLSLTYQDASEDEVCLQTVLCAQALCGRCETAGWLQVLDLEEGLVAAAWSRTQEHLVVLTAQGSVLLINEVAPRACCCSLSANAWQTCQPLHRAGLGDSWPGRPVCQAGVCGPQAGPHARAAPSQPGADAARCPRVLAGGRPILRHLRTAPGRQAAGHACASCTLWARQTHALRSASGVYAAHTLDAKHFCVA